MRFTPTAFLGSSLGTTLIATAEGATSGSFTSGSINYAYIKFTTGSYTLNVTTGAPVDLLIVGGGGGGFTGSTNAGQGGGGGGIYYSEARLYKGIYNVVVGAGGAANVTGSNSYVSAYGISYNVFGGSNDGTSGFPQSNIPGTNIVCAGLNNSAGGGGGSAVATGSSTFCPGNNRPDGGAGAEGVTYNMDGTPSVYASGGGGGSAANAFAQGGNGGTNAGKGASYNTTAINAIDGFGGGGGGERAGNPQQAGSGGHGTIIIRYIIP
jgi:hypothetical protein